MALDERFLISIFEIFSIPENLFEFEMFEESRNFIKSNKVGEGRFRVINETVLRLTSQLTQGLPKLLLKE